MEPSVLGAIAAVLTCLFGLSCATCYVNAQAKKGTSKTYSFNSKKDHITRILLQHFRDEERELREQEIKNQKIEAMLEKLRRDAEMQNSRFLWIKYNQALSKLEGPNYGGKFSKRSRVNSRIKVRALQRGGVAALAGGVSPIRQNTDEYGRVFVKTNSLNCYDTAAIDYPPLTEAELSISSHPPPHESNDLERDLRDSDHHVNNPPIVSVELARPIPRHVQRQSTTPRIVPNNAGGTDSPHSKRLARRAHNSLTLSEAFSPRYIHDPRVSPTDPPSPVPVDTREEIYGNSAPPRNPPAFHHPPPPASSSRKGDRQSGSRHTLLPPEDDDRPGPRPRSPTPINLDRQGYSRGPEPIREEVPRGGDEVLLTGSTTDPTSSPGSTGHPNPGQTRGGPNASSGPRTRKRAESSRGASHRSGGDREHCGKPYRLKRHSIMIFPLNTFVIVGLKDASQLVEAVGSPARVVERVRSLPLQLERPHPSTPIERVSLGGGQPRLDFVDSEKKETSSDDSHEEKPETSRSSPRRRLQTSPAFRPTTNRSTSTPIRRSRPLSRAPPSTPIERISRSLPRRKSQQQKGESIEQVEDPDKILAFCQTVFSMSDSNAEELL